MMLKNKLISLLAIGILSFGSATAIANSKNGKASASSNSKNGKVSDSAKVSDSSITAQVKSKMHSDPTVSGSKIEVSTKDGVVTLTGNLNTDTEASKAIELAESVKGVSDVNTEHLKVKESKHPFADTAITAKVKGKFLKEELFGDKPVAAWTIHVETNDGTVYLTGTADTAAQIENAKNIAKEVKDVKGVQSKVKVEAKETKDAKAKEATKEEPVKKEEQNKNKAKSSNDKNAKNGKNGKNGKNNKKNNHNKT